jgi:hypothetical protein
MSAFCLLLVIIAIASFSSKVERKVRSAASFIVNPISYFESDRGTYLLNTLNMAGHRPFGVGIGDWQTQYPVYRLHNRNLWFNEDFQVRRAHSDHVQMLGEAGWPGIFLWAVFLTTLLAKCVRLWWAAGHRRSLFYAAQIVAMAAAMSVDYVIEHPFCKHQFFLFAFLILSTDANAGAGIARRKTRIRPIGVVFAVLVTCAAAANLAYSFGLAKKIVVSGHLTREYLSALRLRDDPGRGEGKVGASSTALQFDRVIELGNRLNELTGHTKSMYRDYLLVADSLRRLGRSVEAKVALQMSLQLHPHHPPAFREMSVLASDSEWRDSWNSGYRFLMDEATTGYDRPYPPGHPLRIPH